MIKYIHILKKESLEYWIHISLTLIEIIIGFKDIHER